MTSQKKLTSHRPADHGPEPAPVCEALSFSKRRFNGLNRNGSPRININTTVDLRCPAGDAAGEVMQAPARVFTRGAGSQSTW